MNKLHQSFPRSIVALSGDAERKVQELQHVQLQIIDFAQLKISNQCPLKPSRQRQHRASDPKGAMQHLGPPNLSFG